MVLSVDTNFENVKKFDIILIVFTTLIFFIKYSLFIIIRSINLTRGFSNIYFADLSFVNDNETQI